MTSKTPDITSDNMTGGDIPGATIDTVIGVTSPRPNNAPEAEGTPVTTSTAVMPPMLRPDTDWQSVLDQLPKQPIL